MVINISGGNKAKKQKRSIKYESTDKIDEGQLFGIILDKCGGCHFRLMCSDGRSRNGKLSGRMANGPRVNTGSYVIISLRDFEKDQKNCDIIGHGSPSVDIIKILKNNNSNNTKQKDDINFKDSDDEFDDFNIKDLNIKDNDNGNDVKGSDVKGSDDIAFAEGSDDSDTEGTDAGVGAKGSVWNDDDTQSKKVITKDEIDDLIDLL